MEGYDRFEDDADSSSANGGSGADDGGSVDVLSTVEAAALMASGDGDEDNPYAGAAEAARRPEPPPGGFAGGAGTPALEALLAAAEAGRAPEMADLLGIFPYTLDSFQQRAVEALVAGKSVVVCAPTGAGKTAIAEAAAAAVLARGQRVIYTTPLKALSNQKLFETRARFGPSRCGLQTGDTSLNPDGSIVIMTTEILRNIMYRTAETASPGSGGATRDERLADVGLVVLDEVHYLGDPGRGSVWEEVIINCPRHIQLLAMSATVKNPDDLGGWISQEHGDCETITTRFRPVPLRWLFCYSAGGARGPGSITDLLDASGRGLNPKIALERFIKAEARRVLASGRNAASGQDAAAAQKEMERSLRRDALRKRAMMKMIPTPEQVIGCLQAQDALPAIWFILSRVGCDAAALQAGAAGQFTTPEEAAAIQGELDELSAENPESVRTKFVPALLRGVAAHHAGCLPGWKGLVERCFQRGMVKLVFATGTLAAGINMPARTTIISSLARRTDDGIAPLPHNELLQMAGRAGRRGYDTSGNCVVLPTRFEGAEAGVRIIAGGPEPLTSQFSTSYGMVLNLLSVYTLDQAREFLSRSFGQYMSGTGNARRLKEVRALKEEAEALVARSAEPAPAPAASAAAPGAGVPELRAAQAHFRRLSAAARAQRVALVAAAAGGGRLPALVLLNLSRRDGGAPELLPAMAVAVVPSVADTPVAEQAAASGGAPAPASLDHPLLFCLGADNRLMVVAATHVVGMCRDEGLVADLTAAHAATWAALAQGWRSAAGDVRAWRNHAAGMFSVQVAAGGGRTQGVALALNQPHDAFEPLPVDQDLLTQIAAAREAVKAQKSAAAAARKASRLAGGDARGAGAGGGGGGAPGGRAARLRAARLLRKAEQLLEEMGSESATTWNGFLAVMDILEDMGAITEGSGGGGGGAAAEPGGGAEGGGGGGRDAAAGGGVEIQPLGLLARSLQGENQLWMAVALSHPSVMNLTGPQLAGYISALVCSEVIRRPMSVWTPYQVSPEVLAAIEDLEPAREALFEAQTAAGMVRWNESLLIDLRFAGIVEAWAGGAQWRSIMEDVDLDDGDMARLLARTVDVLRQALFLDHLLPYVVGPARDAVRGMDRQPISDLTL